MTDAVSTALIVLGGSVVTILAQLWREQRNRTWRQQDLDRVTEANRLEAANHASALALKVSESAERVANTVAQTAARLEAVNKARFQAIGDKVDQNTEISKAAFTEANNINQKIASIGLQAIDGKPIAPEGK